ncbi:response regulator [Halofilum ochraceum]|uniref:response regulator n=1 Tax=Halofilum ochraceum TaxID=1611323 RepID=UPI00082C217B|nr:response regulator [Halofilum ochraceum]
MHVLLIEDDSRMAAGIQSGLEINGLTVDQVDTVGRARAALATTHTDVAVLDLSLPDGDGMAVLREMRSNGDPTPVLILTARDALDDRVAGLTAGADDYLVKPFELDELVARLHALLRRASGQHDAVLSHGSLRLDPQRRTVFLDGRPVDLSRREFELLHALIHARGTIVSTDRLKDSLYGLSDDVSSNALNVHLHHLRRKLGPEIVETVRGLGYRLGPAPETMSDDGRDSA